MPPSEVDKMPNYMISIWFKIADAEFKKKQIENNTGIKK